MEQLKYTEILQQNNLLKGTLKSNPYNIALLSNITINAFKDILEYTCRVHQIEPNIEVGNFDNIVQDSLQYSNCEMVIVCYDMLGILDTLDKQPDEMSESEFQQLFEKLKSEIALILSNLAKTPAVIFNLFSAAYFPANYHNLSRVEYLAGRLNKFIADSKNANVHLIDINKIFAQTGIGESIDFRFFYSSKAPYTIAFLKELAYAVQPLLLKHNGKLRKAIIFDCDNTLWKGILGEDGAEGINYSKDNVPGRFFNAIQQYVRYLSKQGVIIGLCSKNNKADVDEILSKPDIELSDENIVIKKVNWNDKVSNLRSIAEELNIGLDSLVFIDDSDFEVNLVKEKLPEVLTLQVPKNANQFPFLLQKLVNRYFIIGQEKEDSEKTAMYKAQFERSNAQQSFHNIDDYLASLEIEITLKKDDTAQIPRIAQLTQKTNQFNLTTVRYTEQQITDFIDSDAATIFSIFVKDKFGDSGLTGICIVKKDELNKNYAIIDTLLMSCRIIGRNIEFEFLNRILKILASNNFQKVIAKFIPTKKNAQVSSFFEQMGFSIIKEEEDGTKYYTMEPIMFDNQKHDYIKTTIENNKQSTL